MAGAGLCTRQAVWKRDGFRCKYCYTDLSKAYQDWINENPRRSIPDITVDHIIPRSKGGKNHRFNLLTACRKCNMERGNMPYILYLTTIRK